MFVTTIVSDGKRPCYVQTKDTGRKAIFHRWIELSCPITQTLALVEYEDGTIGQVKPTSLTFIDGGEFEDFDWKEEEDEPEPIEENPA